MSTSPTRRTLLAAILVVLGGTAHPVAAADRFVSVFGDDTANDCLASADPCASLVHTLSQAASGDVIKATQGPYFEQLVIDYSTTLTLSGGWSADFGSRDAAGHPSVLQGFAIDGNTLLTVTAATGDVIDLTLDGFSINRGSHGATLRSQDNGSLTMRLQNCSVKKSHFTTFSAVSSHTSTFDLMLSNSSVSGNKNVSGGGVLSLGAGDTSMFNVTLDDVVVERNVGSRYGSTIFALSAGAAGNAAFTLLADHLTVAKTAGIGMVINSLGLGSTNVDLVNTEVRDNRGTGISAGGAGTSLTLSNTVVARNRSGPGSGGLAVFGGSYSVVNSTIRANRSACCDGGVLLDSGSVDLINTIIWGNRTTNGTTAGLTIDTATVDIDHSDIQPTISGAFNDLGGNISADPLFEAARDHHLTASSPAVDTGTCAGAPATDFEGDPRPSGGGCDMGADELAP